MSRIKLTDGSEFSTHLRENIGSLFPTGADMIAKLEKENYFEEDFYLVLHGTFLVFGWEITGGGLAKADHIEKIPFDLASQILDSLNILNQNYFSVLLVLALCQNAFNYSYKDEIGWETFESWLQTQEFLSPKYLRFVKYRWEITTTHTRKKIYSFLSGADMKKKKIPSGLEEEKKYLFFIASYKNKIRKLENAPEIQEILPDLKLEGGDILKSLEKEGLETPGGVGSKFRVNKAGNGEYDFSQGGWWVIFDGESPEPPGFPELLYFDQNKSAGGARVLTNLLESLGGKTGGDVFKNFISIPSFGPPSFSRKEFVSIFNIYYSGFVMAKIMGSENINSRCPAGSTSREMKKIYHYSLQILAASAAGINIIFWGGGADPSFDYSVEIVEGRKTQGLISEPQFHGLINVGSSCYMDSALFSLLYKSIPIVDEKILRKSVKENLRLLQNELVRIQRSIQGTQEVDTCSDFRKLLRNVPGGYIFSGGEEQDAGEFLLFILNIFQVSGAVTKTTVYGTNDAGENPKLTPTSSAVDKEASVVNFVDSFSLGEIRPRADISDFLFKRSDVTLDSHFDSGGVKFKRKLTEEEVISAPGLYIFYLQRADPITNTVLTKPISPDEKINIGGEILELYSIVIHVGDIDSGHYLVYFKHRSVIELKSADFVEESWYIYNDVTKRIRRIGGFEDMLERKPSAASRGIIYFYS